MGALSVSLTATWLAAGLPPLFAEGPPQLADPVKVFFEAAPVSGELQGGVLVCRVDIVGDEGWDTFGAVDLLATFTVAGRAPVEVWGPEDRANAVVSVPAVNLRPGDKVKIDLEDRDLTEREHIARGVARYAGALPLRFDLDEAQVECRGFSRADAEARARPALDRAAAAAALVETAAPDPAVPGLGLPSHALATAESAALEAEAWLGRTDVVVAGVHQRLKAGARRFEALAREAIHKTKTTLPAPGTPFPIDSLGLEARVVPGKLVTFEVAARKSEVTFDDEDVADRVTFLWARGHDLEMSATTAGDDGDDGEEAGPRTLAPGQTHVVSLRPVGGSEAPEVARVDGVLVRLR